MDHELDYYSKESANELLQKAQKMFDHQEYDQAEEYFLRAFHILCIIMEVSQIIELNDFTNFEWLVTMLFFKQRYKVPRIFYSYFISAGIDGLYSTCNLYSKLIRICMFEGNQQEMYAYYLMEYYYIVEELYKGKLLVKVKQSAHFEENLYSCMKNVRLIYKKILGIDSLEYYEVNVRIGAGLGKLELSQPYFQEAIEWNNRHYGPDSQENIEIMNFMNHLE